MLALPIVILYFVLVWRHFPAFDRLYVSNADDLISDGGRGAIIVLGVALSLLAQAAVVLASLNDTYFHDDASVFYVYSAAILFAPPLLGRTIAWLAKSAIDRWGAKRGRLAINWLGVGIMHGTWANPLLLILYFILSA
jgi:hypothetical protein